MERWTAKHMCDIINGRRTAAGGDSRAIEDAQKI